MDRTTAFQHFTLNKAGPLVASYRRPPDAAAGNAQAWPHRYVSYSLGYGLLRQEGTLELSCTEGPRNGRELSVVCRRLAKSGFSHFTHAHFRCAGDLLSSPVSWEARARMAREPGDPPYLRSGIRKRGKRRGRTVEVSTDGRDVEVFEVGEACTAKWCLMDAVTRLPQEQITPLEFTLVDEVDRPLPGQRLRFRRQARVETGEGELLLTAYEHTGRGVIPTVFWVDTNGLLLFVMTGIEIHVLSADGSGEAAYEESCRMQPPAPSAEGRRP